MSINRKIAGWAAFAVLAFGSAGALAQDHPYTEGQVLNVSRIRTVDGKFDEYMAWLDTTWKKMQEAGKKAGYIVSYQVVTIEPRGPDDADVVLLVYYKNWAALDGATAKTDAMMKAAEGSVAAANQSEFDRAKIRRFLGSSTMQVLDLK
jgi:hypothetical protein